jgi:SAM-dependent methyltransferase
MALGMSTQETSRASDAAAGVGVDPSAREVACNLCGARDEQLLRRKEGYRFVRCRQCGLIYVNPQIHPDTARRVYSEQYFRHGGAWLGYEDYLKDKPLYVEMFGREVRLLGRYKSPGHLLDIGCATGFFLEVAERRGWQPFGVEVSEFAAEHARKLFGDRVYIGTVEEARYECAFFDAIACYSTLEHLCDPLATLKEAHRILKPDGVLVVSVPDVEHWLSRRSFQWKPTEHLFYFSPKTLSAMFAAAGFETLHTREMRRCMTLGRLAERMDYYLDLGRGLELLLALLGLLRLRDRTLFVSEGLMVAYAKKGDAQ